jgi:hypothetical protein
MSSYFCITIMSMQGKQYAKCWYGFHFFLFTSHKSTPTPIIERAYLAKRFLIRALELTIDIQGTFNAISRFVRL